LAPSSGSLTLSSEALAGCSQLATPWIKVNNRKRADFACRSPFRARESCAPEPEDLPPAQRRGTQADTAATDHCQARPIQPRTGNPDQDENLAQSPKDDRFWLAEPWRMADGSIY